MSSSVDKLKNIKIKIKNKKKTASSHTRLYRLSRSPLELILPYVCNCPAGFNLDDEHAEESHKHHSKRKYPKFGFLDHSYRLPSVTRPTCTCISEYFCITVRQGKTQNV